MFGQQTGEPARAFVVDRARQAALDELRAASAALG
jgi:hypothetical protein